jgi:cytochrome c-type biogenesis protein CcmH
MELVAQALELDYEDEKALELAGLAAYQQQKWAESLHFWRRLMKKLPKNSEFYEEIARAVKIAEGKAMEASGLGERARLAPPEKSQTPH